MIVRILIYFTFSFLLTSPLSKLVDAQDTTNVDSTSVSPMNITKKDTTGNHTQLEKFRKVFDDLVSEEKSKNPEIAKAEQDPVLELGGFVLDETRSKMGRDFYSLFYQKWEAPEDASNFTITITEQPTFGRGSQVTIKMDYEVIFNARLQPRYEYIDALSTQAVARCRKIIQQQASVKQQLMGY